MERITTIVFAVILCLGVTIFPAWFLWRWLQRSQDAPLVLMIKWVVSAILLVLAFGGFFVLGPFAPFLVVFCAIGLSVLWTPNIGSKLASLMSGDLDGGSTPLEPKPTYSVAQRLRNRGQYPECVAELRKQLVAFPDDYEGETMLAEVLAENLGDFYSAQVILERIANSGQRPAPQRAYALTQLADWHLKFNQDTDAARAAFQNIIDWLPGTEQARKAAQRLSHLAVNRVMGSSERLPVALRRVDTEPEALEESFKDHTDELVELTGHLERNPHDAEARERLARLYCDHFGDAAAGIETVELGAMLAAKSSRDMARWLNLKAELQVQKLNDVEGAAATLRRLVEEFPDSAIAVAAEQRIARLGVEARGKNKSQSIRLGSYDSDLGLSGGKTSAEG